MNGARARNSANVVISSGVTPAASHVSRMSRDRSYAQGSRSPKSFSACNASSSARGIVSISGAK